jgi:hypothetical protein
MRKNAIYLWVSIVAIAALMLTGCSGVIQKSSSLNTQNAGHPTGKLVIMVTDAPTTEKILAINVTVYSLQVHQAEVSSNSTTPTVTATASVLASTPEQEQEQENDNSGWITLELAKDQGKETKTFDLLTVAKVEDLLASHTLAIGKYTQIRMELTFPPKTRLVALRVFLF